MKRIAAALVSIVAFLSLVGCSSNKTVQNIKPPPDFVPLNDVVEGQKNIYLIVKNLDSSYWQVIINAAEESGRDNNCNVYYSGTYAESDWESQEKLLNDAVNSGADAILISPNDSVQLSGKIDDIHENGIPVVLIDTVVNTNNYDVCYMTDNLMAGQKAAEEMYSQFLKNGYTENDSVKVGIQVGSTSSQTINERLAGFFNFWSKNAPEKWEIIPDIKCNEGYVDRAVDCAEELLKYDGIKGVFGTNNGSTVGFAKAVKEAERKDVVVIGFDYSEEIAELINNDEYLASTILQKQYDMGYVGVQTAMDLINGAKLPAKFKDTGVVVVNNETKDEPEARDAISHA